MIKKEKNSFILEELVNLMNKVLRCDSIPEEIFSCRLVCFNKKANEPGNLDNIRPISINNTYMKIIEKCLLTKIMKMIYSKKMINKKQIGFMDVDVKLT